MPTTKPDNGKKRKYEGMRVDREILRRVQQLAKKTRTSKRAIWEQIADRALPELEQQYGIDPQAPESHQE